MSGNPGSNVVPMPGSWPTPSPWPAATVPPGCFSELARLNQCYNEIQMMEMILSKVVCDLAKNNTAFQQCLVEAIAASGSNVPLIGVTNGTDAQPGQVGEWVELHQAFPIATGTNTQVINMGVLQPGDWTLFNNAQADGPVQTFYFSLSPQPPGFSSNLGGYNENSTGVAGSVVGSTGRALTSAPSLIVYAVTTTASAATTGHLNFSARRAR